MLVQPTLGLEWIHLGGNRLDGPRIDNPVIHGSPASESDQCLTVIALTRPPRLGQCRKIHSSAVRTSSVSRSRDCLKKRIRRSYP
jgi:hypothetical protein